MADVVSEIADILMVALVLVTGATEPYCILADRTLSFNQASCPMKGSTSVS